jgi:ferritin-like metal-binding protein YciE
MDEPIKRYLEDAIAAEKAFESQLQTFAKEASLPQVRTLFEQHADETREQYEALTARLKALGGSTSLLKSFMAHVFGMAPKTAQLGHDEAERTTQDLMMAFAVENAEVAMYESLKVASETAGDEQTASLARTIQAQEQATADKVWQQIPLSARHGFESVRTKDGAASNAVITRYIQDAEAAERNFEDALAGFSKIGNQSQVQSLMAMMSRKAATQHQRLRSRLEMLGGTPSTSKSLLAHLLAFTPLTAQFGHDESEKSTQHLMITYAAAAAEMAMYESLHAASLAAGDQDTATLALQLQAEEKEDQRLAWENLAPSARVSSQAVLGNA